MIFYLIVRLSQTLKLQSFECLEECDDDIAKILKREEDFEMLLCEPWYFFKEHLS